VPNVLLATDADWIYDEVDAVLGDDETTVVRVRTGREVLDVVRDVAPGLVVLDLQIGNMGGMAVCMALRLDESGGRISHVPVLMLLDRKADIHLARRSDAEGWLIKPLDPLRLRKAATAVLDGGAYTEGLPAEPPRAPEPAEPDAAESGAEESGAEEPATTG
jgi:DNA-binding response OmpR family regulator